VTSRRTADAVTSKIDIRSVPHPTSSTRIRHHSEMLSQVNHPFRSRHHTGYVIRTGQSMQCGR
jgi:hypothetical protein